MKAEASRFNESIGEYLLGGARPYLVIILIGLLLYSGASFFGLSYLDDNILILDNREFINNISSIVTAFRTSVFHVLNEYDAAYRPMLTVSFIIDAHLDKYLGLGYHFTNVILHIIASCLVFLLFLKLKYSKPLAFSFALIFTVHPALTQAVAWIPGRNDLLLGIFAIICFISLINFLDSVKWRCYAWHIILLFLALLTKETALALIVVSACYCGFIAGKMGQSQSTGRPLIGTVPIHRKTTRWDSPYFSRAALLVGWAFTVAAWLILRTLALSHDPVTLSAAAIARDLVTGAPAMLIYLGKVLFPYNLSIIPIMADSTLVYGIAAALVILLGLCLSKERRNRFVLFGAIWFIAFLLPTFIQSVPDGPAVFMESRIYLPMLGIFIILGEIDMIKRFSFNSVRSFVLLTVITGTLFYLSMTYANYYQNPVTFWELAVERSPHSSMAQYNLGWIYGLQHRGRDAEARYLKALKLNPRQRYVHNSLGCIYEYWGMPDKAESEYVKEIEITPYYDSAYKNLANLYIRRGKQKEANELLKNIKKNNDKIYLP